MVAAAPVRNEETNMSIDPCSDRFTRTPGNRDASVGWPSGASAGRPAARRWPWHLASLGAAAALAAAGTILGCGTSPAELAAPTRLEAMLATPGVHLTWEDRSTGEESFMILRREGTGAYAEVGQVGENVTAFHDSTVGSGATYTYVVHSMNAASTSAPSNEATIAVP